MSDVRFACPFCSQHIACDRSFTGSAIDCPACGRRITAPKPLAVGDRGVPIPVALPAAPAFEKLGLWTEEAWAEHARKNPGAFTVSDSRWALPQLPVLLAALLPGLVLIGASAPIMWIAIVVGAIVSGGVTAHASVAWGDREAFRIMGFVTGVIYFAILAEFFLLGGCCWPGR
jgi:hypothetical protein